MSARKQASLWIYAGLLSLGAMIVACSPPASTPKSGDANSSTGNSSGGKMWVDPSPVVSVKELMHDMIDPLADLVFESVKVVIDKHGTVETKPKTDEDWDRIRIGATVLIEGSELLKIQRPFAPTGDMNNSEGPDAPELSPAQITAKVQKDPVAWQAKIQALRNVGLEVMEIIKTKDAEKLWDAGEDLDEACENCHVEYWYPGDPKLLERLDKRLEELYGPRADRTPLGMRKR